MIRFVPTAGADDCVAGDVGPFRQTITLYGNIIPKTLVQIVFIEVVHKIFGPSEFLCQRFDPSRRRRNNEAVRHSVG